MRGRPLVRKLRLLGTLALLPVCASARHEDAWEGRYALELRVASVARVPVIGARPADCGELVRSARTLFRR